MRLPFAFIALLVLSCNARAEQAVRVFAAASLSSVLNEIGKQWQQAGHPAPSLAYAASSALAKQIEAGAPADLFASADLGWMDYVEQKSKLVPGTRISLLGNALVLIAPLGRSFKVDMRAGGDLAQTFEGKLCTGETSSVPAGVYARQSLTALGWWDALQGRIVGADDVRTALAFVERGECAAGIVYATDAVISDKVEVVATFPADSRKPVIYPFALIADARPEAAAFLDYLKTSPAAAAVFQRNGFVLLMPK
ncbi:MAG: molybdate ABC transporter substrate-binding protein [Nevskia sp.]|nr:molybdate ABC transporter substrate-binding protein [Nevskia sp.]